MATCPADNTIKLWNLEKEVMFWTKLYKSIQGEYGTVSLVAIQIFLFQFHLILLPKFGKTNTGDSIRTLKGYK